MIYYTRISDFKVGEEVDNLCVGICKIVAIKATSYKTRGIRLSNGRESIYSCRGWVTVEYLGCQLDGSDEKLYQRCDPIIGISEIDVEKTNEYQQWEKEGCDYSQSVPTNLEYDCLFRQVGFSDNPWPKPVDKIWKLDKVRDEKCRYCKTMCELRKIERPAAKICDPRNGDPMCWDCYDDLQND